MSLARPPVGWQSMTLHDPQRTTDWAWLNTVVIWKQPGHLMSMKKLFGLCTRRLSLCVLASCSAEGCKRSIGILTTAIDLKLEKSVIGMEPWWVSWGKTRMSMQASQRENTIPSPGYAVSRELMHLWSTQQDKNTTSNSTSIHKRRWNHAPTTCHRPASKRRWCW